MKEFSPDQYITEIAEERKEMENLGEGITPSPEEYTQVLNYLIANIERELKQNKWRGLAKVTEAFRIEYYKLMKNFYLTKKQRMPSYAGFASAQISPTGDVWECAVYATFMGNLRNYDFDFKRLWHSNQAWEVRRRVKKEHKCPLANESYINLLFSPMHLIKVATRII
jgi:MoaA/NifB/PqqE/SkfB family radical SAM enzyme